MKYITLIALLLSSTLLHAQPGWGPPPEGSTPPPEGEEMQEGMREIMRMHMMRKLLSMPDHERADLLAVLTDIEAMTPEERQEMVEEIDTFLKEHQEQIKDFRDKKKQMMKAFKSMAPEDRQKMKDYWKSLSPEDRKAKRKELKEMSQEERQAWRDSILSQ